MKWPLQFIRQESKSKAGKKQCMADLFQQIAAISPQNSPIYFYLVFLRSISCQPKCDFAHAITWMSSRFSWWLQVFKLDLYDSSFCNTDSYTNDRSVHGIRWRPHGKSRPSLSSSSSCISFGPQKPQYSPYWYLRTWFLFGPAQPRSRLEQWRTTTRKNINVPEWFREYFAMWKFSIISGKFNYR